MSAWIDVSPIEDLAPGQSKCVQAGKESIAVFNVEGAYYACSDTCPHAGGPLHQGMVRGTVVVCPYHGWTFDLCAGPDAPKDGVDRYPVRVMSGMIQVQAE